MKKEVCLNQIASYSKGKQINTNDLIGNAKYFYLNGGVYPSGKWDSYNVKGDTVTISEGGNSSGYVNYMSSPFWCGAHCYYLYDLKCNPKYLYYALKSQQDRLMAIRSGACMPNIKKSDLGKFVLKIDDDNYVQEKAIIVFDSLSGLIENRKQQLEQLDLLIKSRFVEMFGDPKFNPKNWNESALKEHLNVVGGYAFKSEKFKEKGIPVLRIGNINSGHFLPSNMVYWDYDTALEKYLLKAGDLVMSLTGTVGKDDYGNVCILGNDYELYYLNQRNAKLELVNGIDKYYLSELLKFSTVKKRLTGISRGVRQANISNSDILNLVVPVPPIELQNKFADFVEQVEKSKTEVKKALDEAQLLFDSLMQEYFG